MGQVAHREFLFHRLSLIWKEAQLMLLLHSCLRCPTPQPVEAHGHPTPLTSFKPSTCRKQRVENLIFCTEQNSGWCNSYTHLFNPGNPAGASLNRRATCARLHIKMQDLKYQKARHKNSGREGITNRKMSVVFSLFLIQTLDHKNPR